MSELPWFKFFSGEYLGDPRVDDCPREAEGLLVRSWCVCHREGSCPADFATLARKTHCSIEYVERYFRFCEPFFEQRDGRLYSLRMEQERQRSEIARQNANQRYLKNPRTKSKAKNLERESSEHGSANGNATRSAISTAKAPRSRACRMPENFAPKETHRALAAESGIDLQKTLDAFVDHHLARGTTFTDWDRAFNNWIRREPAFSRGFINGGTSLTLVEKNRIAAEEYERKKAASEVMQ